MKAPQELKRHGGGCSFPRVTLDQGLTECVHRLLQEKGGRTSNLVRTALWYWLKAEHPDLVREVIMERRARALLEREEAEREVPPFARW